MQALKDLFGQYSTSQSKRLYSLYLSTLMSCSRERRVVEACRKIQGFAIRHEDAALSDFTHGFAIEALCKLGDFRGAWDELRRLERFAFGRNIDLKSKDWTSDELSWFSQYHPQILFFLGRYKLAARLLEAALAEKMSHPRKGLSYEVLPVVFNSIVRPRQRHEVTLFHLYGKLGRNLGDWEQWEAFVNGFDSRLFQLSRLAKHDLLVDASLLQRFTKSIAHERKQRLTARITMGEKELVAPSGKVRRFQAIVNQKKNQQAVHSTLARKELEEVFPDLRRLMHLTI